MAAATTDLGQTAIGAYSSPEPACSLAEVLDRILHLGVSLEGNLTISLANVDLLYLDLRLLLASVDTVWPEGRPTSCAAPEPDPVPVPPPPLPPPPSPDHLIRSSRTAGIEEPIGSGVIAAGAMAPSAPAAAPPAPVAGLVRLVLTLVKVLHDVLERQAVRRMDGGNLTPAQIEAVGAGLLAQAEEIELLRRHFGFPDRELALNFGLSDRSI
jgi:Gas vesicle protein K/Gas vesicle protein